MHQAPLMITEYGIDPSADNAALWMNTLEAEMDRALASRFYWLYEEYSQSRWGLFDEDKTLRLSWAKQVARPFPTAIEGILLEMKLSEGRLSLRIRGQGQHRITIPALWAPQGVTVTCNGSPVETMSDSGGLWLHCDGAEENNIEVLAL